MDRKKAEEIANYRYRLISPIVSKESLCFGEIAEQIREAAGKHYQIPGTRKSRVSVRTIERYLKQYREGGFEALMPKFSVQRQSRITRDYIEWALDLKREHPKRTVNQVIEILEMSGQVPKGILKQSTLYDHFKREGLTRERGKKESKAYQRFSPKHRNQRWQGDSCHLLHIPDPKNPKKKIKLYLICWLDEATRIVTHGQLYTDEKTYALEDSLKKALLKYGLVEQIYVDNGSIYSSHHLQRICGRLGTTSPIPAPTGPRDGGNWNACSLPFSAASCRRWNSCLRRGS